MAFSQAAISDPRISFADAQLYISWTSSAPAGTWYQVYCNRELLWSGTATSAHLPWQVGQCQIDIGAVDSGADAVNDYSSTLTGGFSNRALLTWEGGTFQGLAIDHFAIYSGLTPGGAVSYTKPVGKVPAYHAGIVLDGWGMGGWNRGGWGHSASAYTWRSGVLAAGTWNFGIKPVDVAGNASGSPATASVVITAPPRPPAPDASGVRLRAAVASRVPTLTWNASP